MTDEEDKIQAANAQLSRVKLSLRGKKLYVKGTLPPKPGEYKARQREIPTNCNASPSQIKIALALAKKIEAELLLGKFTWDDYSKEKSKPAETIAEWVDRYEQNYWERTECNPTTERSFETGYRHYFRQLPQDKPLTLDLLRSTLLLKSPAATRSRQMYTMSYRRLAEFASSKGAIDRLELETFRIELRELRGGSVSDLLFST